MRKHTPPQSLFFLVGEEIAHCPLTVPSGDTPCLTAGDARRVNPWRVEKWRSGEGEKKETSQPAPTVPGGDTPCLTAGDAQKANPWRSGEGSLRHRRCRTTPTLVTPSTLAVRRRRRRSPLCTHLHGFTLAPLGHHPRLSMVRLHRRRELCST